MSTQELAQMEEMENNTIKDISIEEIIPNSIDGVVVNVIEGHHTIFLPMNMSGIHFKAWNRGKGGVFSRDVLDYSLNRKPAKYVLITGKLSCIARLIAEEEELSFKTLKLVDGKIKDSSFMILRNLNEGEKLTSVQTYTDDKPDFGEVIIVSNDNKIPQDEELEYRGGSISLFSE